MDKRLEALLRGTTGSASFGLDDELSGLMGSGIDKILGLSDQNKKLQEQGFTGDIGPTSSSEVYSRDRDQYRQAVSQLAKEHPNYHLAGEVAGGAMNLVPGSNAVKAGALGAAKFGGKIGALNAFGRTEESDPLAVAKDAVFGGVVGAGTAGALSKAPAIMNKALEKADDLVDSTETALRRKFILPKQVTKAQSNTKQIMDEITEMNLANNASGKGHLYYNSNDPQYQSFLKRMADGDEVRAQAQKGKSVSEEIKDQFSSSSVDDVTNVTDENQNELIKRALKKIVGEE